MGLLPERVSALPLQQLPCHISDCGGNNSGSCVPAASLPQLLPEGPVCRAEEGVDEDARAPPLWVANALAQALRSASGLSLFNVDVLVPEAQQQSWEQQGGEQQGGDRDDGVLELIVVDINYMPGFDKVAGSAPLLADWLKTCAAPPGLLLQAPTGAAL
jgi:Inositol 1,3,4-trisphosphate 5/6-kinase ATP-grasp domain